MNAAATDPDLDWSRDGSDWPLRETSRFVAAGGLHWHVQTLGSGPVALLIHGTGAATHSWRDLAPLLARQWTVVAFDLPGHGFTRGTPARGLSLEGMVESIAALLRSLALQPDVVIGHSAGAAIAARITLDGRIAPRGLVSLNGALLPLRGLQAMTYTPLARILAALPFTPGLFSWRARERSAVERLVASTGSQLDARGVELYWRLIRNPVHVAGVLQMMSQWHLEALQRDLPRLAVPLAQLVGARDRTVPPAVASRVRELLPMATVTLLPELGHLAHEEQPELVARTIVDLAGAWHV